MTTEPTDIRQLDDILREIARETLDIETLDTRDSDRLDFHELPVWMLRDSLEAAYEAGRAAGDDELTDALDFLLQQTVDMDLAHGIELTEGEREAREQAIAAIARATGNPNRPSPSDT